MPYTFGAATSDRMSVSLSTNWPNSGRGFLWSGWYRPSLLTPGRCLWGSGSIAGGRIRCEIAATTSELSVVIPRATTTTVATTSGLALTANEWRFIAIAMTHANGTTATNDIRVWAGTELQSPQPITATVGTAGGGNATLTPIFVLGNDSTAGAVAFQGDIGNQFAAVSGSTGRLSQNTNGTFAASDTQLLFNGLVVPFWSGISIPPWFNSQEIGPSLVDIWAMEMDTQVPQLAGLNLTTIRNPLTVVGATQTAERTPVPIQGLVTAMPLPSNPRL